MQNTFKILAGLLDRYEPEVEGRALCEPPADVQRQLRSLAAGELPKPEQAAIFADLSRNPGWVEWLALQIKTRRGEKS